MPNYEQFQVSVRLTFGVSLDFQPTEVGFACVVSNRYGVYTRQALAIINHGTTQTMSTSVDLYPATDLEYQIQWRTYGVIVKSKVVIFL